MAQTDEARQRVFRVRPLAVLVAGLAGGLAPLASVVPTWLLPLLLVLAAWRLHLEAARKPLPSRWTLLGFTILGALAVLASLRGPATADSVVALLALLAGAKLLETRTPRDGAILALLGYFLVLTDLLYRTSPGAASFAGAVVVVLTAGLVDVADERGRRPFARNVRLAAGMLARSAPVAAALFVLFPRLDAPLWGATRGAHGRTGLSETLSPGSLSELALSEEVAFRASLGPDFRAAGPLYWRGPVLEATDGAAWTVAPRGSAARLAAYPAAQPAARPAEGAPDGATVQTITLEPSSTPWLPALDAPVSAPPQATLTATWALRAARPADARVRYRVASAYPPRDAAPDASALQLPPRVSPRVRALAARLGQTGRSDAGTVDAALRYIRSGAYFYTLRPRPLADDPVDDFLFETRQGYCEHYAAAFTLLMRLAGVPARVVTGYLGGEWNPLGEYWIVRQYDAHAWSEVWLRGRGWQRVDPTSAVAPERVEQGLSARLAAGSAARSAGGGTGRWLGLLWDSVDNGWNQWVLGYGAERQRALLTRFGLADSGWQGLTTSLAVALAALLSLAVRRAERARGGRPDPALAVYRRYCRKLGARGLPRLPQEGHRAYAERIGRLRPDLGPNAREVAEAYEALRYARPSGDRDRQRRTLAELRRAVSAARP